MKHLRRTLEEMEDISGVGQKKLELDGHKFLSIIRRHVGEAALPEVEAGSDAAQKGGCCQVEDGLEFTLTRMNARQQKAEVIRLLKEGKLSSGEIAKRVGVSPPTVWACKAHITMGTYGGTYSKTDRIKPE